MLNHKVITMAIVTSEKYARQWFEKYPGKEVVCMNNEDAKKCSTLEEALEFYGIVETTVSRETTVL